MEQASGQLRRQKPDVQHIWRGTSLTIVSNQGSGVTYGYVGYVTCPSDPGYVGYVTYPGDPVLKILGV